jgi:hypothetical protein
MPEGWRRFHNTGQRHFTPGSSPELPEACSCYRRQPFLGSARRRDYFLKVFEEVRHKYDLVMPEHFHILISEPVKGNVARVLAEEGRVKIGTPSILPFAAQRVGHP